MTPYIIRWCTYLLYRSSLGLLILGWRFVLQLLRVIEDFGSDSSRERLLGNASACFFHGSLWTATFEGAYGVDAHVTRIAGLRRLYAFIHVWRREWKVVITSCFNFVTEIRGVLRNFSMHFNDMLCRLICHINKQSKDSWIKSNNKFKIFIFPQQQIYHDWLE